jgi:hypothetical protein
MPHVWVHGRPGEVTLLAYPSAFWTFCFTKKLGNLVYAELGQVQPTWMIGIEKGSFLAPLLTILTLSFPTDISLPNRPCGLRRVYSENPTDHRLEGKRESWWTRFKGSGPTPKQSRTDGSWCLPIGIML